MRDEERPLSSPPSSLIPHPFETGASLLPLIHDLSQRGIAATGRADPLDQLGVKGGITASPVGGQVVVVPQQRGGAPPAAERRQSRQRALAAGGDAQPQVARRQQGGIHEGQGHLNQGQSAIPVASVVPERPRVSGRGARLPREK